MHEIYDPKDYALQYIFQSIAPRNPRSTFRDYVTVAGISHLDITTLNKLIGIIHFGHSSKAGDSLIAELCNGSEGTEQDRKTRIKSLHYFLFLCKEESISKEELYLMLRSLHFNKKRFIDCSTPKRRKEVEALLRFIIASRKYDFSRGISYNFVDGSQFINSPKLIELIIENKDNSARLIDLFYVQGMSLDRVAECLSTTPAMQEGAL